MRFTYRENYATRVEGHCDKAKVSTFLCENSAAKGNFSDAQSHVKDAIAELEQAISELKGILPEEKSE